MLDVHGAREGFRKLSLCIHSDIYIKALIVNILKNHLTSSHYYTIINVKETLKGIIVGNLLITGSGIF